MSFSSFSTPWVFFFIFFFFSFSLFSIFLHNFFLSKTVLQFFFCLTALTHPHFPLSLSLSLSVYLTDCPHTSLPSLSVPVCLSLFLSVCLSTCLFLCVSLSVSFFPFVFLSMILILSTYLFICCSVIYLYFYPSI